jgi:hypothetical protein
MKKVKAGKKAKNNFEYINRISQLINSKSAATTIQEV